MSVILLVDGLHYLYVGTAGRGQVSWPITLMCEVLELSPSGYFSWQARRDVQAGQPGLRLLTLAEN
ncbi:hypothetical protein J7U46_22705 [Pelomonas sp. V22]|uniref:hypothetical protein n=1 Tax=Pelomonas sp. V22 TaxID=2822139 RepID=UPI0024A9F2C6|nr:hypothetical protein [Pelomonas sp. V22]MDI4635893.1 hypothetical protein [Pelomonas sp. V22]